MVDPGFQTVMPIPEGVRQTIILQFFLPKTAWKWKNLDWEGARVSGTLLYPQLRNSQIRLS